MNLFEFSKEIEGSEENLKIDKLLSTDEQKKYIVSFMSHLFPEMSYSHSLTSARSKQDSELQEFLEKLQAYTNNHKIVLTRKQIKKMSEDPSLEEIDKFDEDDPEDTAHIADYYDKEDKKKKGLTRKDEEPPKPPEDEEPPKEDPRFKKKEERDVDSLFNTSFDELSKKEHAYAERYGKDIWNSVENTMKQSNVFKKLPNRDQKIVAHQVLLDLHHALDSGGKMNAVQQTKFSKMFLMNNQTFFQTKTRGYSSKEKFEDSESDIWKSLEDINPNISYEQLPVQIRGRISKESYMQAYNIVNKAASASKMSANQRKSFTHLMTSFGSDLEHNVDHKLSLQQRNKIMFAFGNRISKYVQHMLREHMEIPEDAELLTERTASIRWRRNPRTHLNKIVMTCKTGEYKKSLNKQLKVAGQTVKEVMCLPSSTKPAAQKAKDRISSLKRWRKIKANPGKMTRSKLKGKMTKRFSKTLR